ncbi:hypothetical protein TVAG_267050 [Trichomonas vaginalis G3]|uniref:Uncharacterized protein n=1 Tax=Trichomonas vaginalis (strain ATCC PRA-98 / G3) TaxID=412133 RepID=A2DQQ8_TRIV3|nr:hypothetical protein TVAGG3_0589780 [Trichomonas vaginalis G3]EAY17342.1 hypothetical protein TVAG_267050 [Trichomonas vaginalis G3]KAI5523169.1 hypothetical protein TVAGG3_0589780 [Trichomonas vaginalis G3]|eukprot:XP_001329565.1 hypothetical protein [Trichomonas vaginalis G3]
MSLMHRVFGKVMVNLSLLFLISLIVQQFVFVIEILQKFEFKLEAPEILIYPPEIFDYFRYKKVTNIPFLTSVEHLVNPFIEPLLLHDYSVFTSPENESLLFKNVYLALIAVSTGYKFEVEKLTVLFKSFILFGSPRIVDTLLKLADKTMNENESTTVFVKFLIIIVDEYFDKISTRFVYKQNTIQTVFTIISFLKRMFNKFSSIREFMLQTAALHPIVTFAVLNNSLECLREGVTFKCILSSFTGVEGKIKSFDEIENKAVAIVDDKEYEIEIDNCGDLVVNCEVKVDLNPISDISNLIYLFNYQYKEEYKDIFRLASILEFVKTEKFTSQISQHVNLDFLKNCFSEGFIHSQSFQNFFSSFSLATTCKNDFGFSLTSKLTEYPSNKGIFIVNNGSAVFTSPAIYPRAKFEMILETPKSSKSKSQVSINIYAESDVPKALLTWSKSIKLGPEEKFTIKTVPEQLLLDVNSTMISISPSVSKIFIVFTLSEGATLKYDVNVDSKIFKVSQKMSGNILRLSSNHPGVIPPLQKMFLLAKSCETSSQISFRIKQKILSLLYLSGLHPLSTEEIISIIPIATQLEKIKLGVFESLQDACQIPLLIAFKFSFHIKY